MPAQNKVWTILEVLKWSEEFLKAKGLPAPRADAEQLLAAVLNKDRLYLYTSFDKPLEKAERDKYKEYILRRAKQEPVQYIAGSTYFFGLTMEVNKNVLIPRPDTEVLVEAVLENVKKEFPDEKITIIDIGTGSGAIALALAKYLPAAKILALDNSTAALELAAKNARLNNLENRIEFVNSDLLTALIHRHFETKIILVSNPPYVNDTDYVQLPAEVKDYEPRSTLYAPENGLYFYRRILDQSAVLGQELSGVFLEVGYNQAEAVKNIILSKYNTPVQVREDLGGINRVVYTFIS